MQNLIFDNKTIKILAGILILFGIVLIGISLIMVNGNLKNYVNKQSSWYQTIRVTDSGKIDVGIRF